MRSSKGTGVASRFLAEIMELEHVLAFAEPTSQGWLVTKQRVTTANDRQVGAQKEKGLERERILSTSEICAGSGYADQTFHVAGSGNEAVVVSLRPRWAAIFDARTPPVTRLLSGNCVVQEVPSRLCAMSDPSNQPQKVLLFSLSTSSFLCRTLEASEEQHDASEFIERTHQQIEDFEEAGDNNTTAQSSGKAEVHGENAAKGKAGQRGHKNASGALRAPHYFDFTRSWREQQHSRGSWRRQNRGYGCYSTSSDASQQSA